jgi:voltage-gated sodium channel
MMIGIVLETLQQEHEKASLETGVGESAEVHWIKEHTTVIEQRLERIETLLAAQTNPEKPTHKANKADDHPKK